MKRDIALAHEMWDRYAYCRDNGHLDFVAKADKCEKFFAGDQWDAADAAALKCSRRPAITINKILSTIGTVLGEQIQNRVEVLFRPRSGAPAEVAEALTKVWMQIGQNNQLTWVRSDVFADGIIRSRGFYDVRLDFNDAMQGEVRIEQLNGKNVVIDPDAEEYDPDKWADVFLTKWMTSNDIAVLYSKEAATELENTSPDNFMYGYDSVERYRDRFSGLQFDAPAYSAHHEDTKVRRNIRVLERQYRKLDNQLHFVDVETGDMRPVPEGWDRNKVADILTKAGGALNTTKKLVKRIRWATVADSIILKDEWSPYKHFTVVPYFPYFRYGRTIGLVENLIGPQEILNKVSSQELHVINTTANSGYIVEENSLANMSIEELETRGAETGLVIEYRKGAQPPEKLKPNQVPTGLDRVSMKTEDHIKTISGVSDSMQGFDREDVAAKAIAYKQQRGMVNLSKASDNLERTDFLLARNVLDIVQTYYTEPRLITIVKDTVTHDQEEIEVNQPDPVTGTIINDLTIGEYDIVITSTPSRATLEDSQFEQARAMLELGLPIPPEILIENSRLMRRADIIKQMTGDKESPEAQAEEERKQRGQEAEVAKMEADTQLTMAQAELNKVRAQKEMMEAQQSGGPDQQALLQAQIEQQRMEQQMLMEQQKLEQQMALEREKMEFEHALEREKLTFELEMKREEARIDMEIKKQQAEQQAVAQRVAAARQAQQQTAAPKPANP
jgi:hypothetical protein